MTNQEFLELVKRRTEEARQHPRRFRLRAKVLATLGPVILLGLPLIVLAMGLIIWPLLFAGIGLLIAAITATISGLRLSFKIPEGVNLTADTAPELFKLLESVRIRIAAPRLDFVVLTNDFNAALAEYPLHGFTGWRSYLILGFPLMLALSADQFRAIVAHEMAHLAGSHAKIDSVLIRNRNATARLYDFYSRRRGMNAWLCTSVLVRYLPQLDACVHALRRQHEYECDAIAARAASNRAVAEMLLIMPTVGTLKNKPYWEGMWRVAQRQSDPPPNAYEHLLAFFRVPEPLAVTSASIDAALKDHNPPTEAHPDLVQRLAALGFSLSANEYAAWLATPTDSAVETFFPNNLPQIVEQMNQQWARQSAEPWKKVRATILALQQTRAELTEKSAHEPLSIDEQNTLADAVARLDGMPQAMPLFQAICAAAPNRADVTARLGSYLLSVNDVAGVELVERAAKQNAFFRADGYKNLAAYYERIGNAAEAAAGRERAARAAEELQRALKDGGSISVQDVLLPSELKSDEIARIVSRVERSPRIGRIYVVRKRVQNFPEVPCYLIIASTRLSRQNFFANSRNVEAAILKELQGIIWPPRSNFFAFGSKKWRLMLHITKVPGALIYDSATQSKPAEPTTKTT